MIPLDFLMQFCEIKNKITEHVFEAYEEPPNYVHLNGVQKLLHKIKYQNLKLNAEDCREIMVSSTHRTKLKTLIKNAPTIDYNMFGTVTGRLTTNPDSFPVLTMKKEYRKIVKPINDLFISLDYNGAEIRTLLSLCGQSQPKEDVHMWNIHNIFEDSEMSREAAKLAFFAWLYNPDSNEIRTSVYDKEKILDKYYVDGKRSFISIIIHDEIVIDYCDEERELIAEIKKEFEGDYLSNVRGGKNLYDLSELKI